MLKKSVDFPVKYAIQTIYTFKNNVRKNLGYIVTKAYVVCESCNYTPNGLDRKYYVVYPVNGLNALENDIHPLKPEFDHLNKCKNSNYTTLVFATYEEAKKICNSKNARLFSKIFINENIDKRMNLFQDFENDVMYATCDIKPNLEEEIDNENIYPIKFAVEPIYTYANNTGGLLGYIVTKTFIIEDTTIYSNLGMRKQYKVVYPIKGLKSFESMADIRTPYFEYEQCKNSELCNDVFATYEEAKKVCNSKNAHLFSIHYPYQSMEQRMQYFQDLEYKIMGLTRNMNNEKSYIYKKKLEKI